MISKQAALAATSALALAAAAASAQVTLDLGTFVVDDDPSTGDISLTIPAGTYTSYSFTTDWSAGIGDPWSIEAIWAVTDGPAGDPNTTFYEDPGPSPDGQTNGDSVTLNWDGFFDIPVTSSGTAGEYFLLTLQTFPGSSATWANTTFTLGFDELQPPPSTMAMLDSDGSIESTLDAGEVEFYEFDYNGTDDFVISTAGSGLQPDNDTELGLYDESGTLVLTNDDSGTFLSALVVNGGDIDAGTYYLAVGGFNTTFGPEFGAVSSSTNTGPITITGLSVPEPTSLALLGLGGLAALRRRRN